MKRRVAIQHRIEVHRDRPSDFPTYWARLRPAASRGISAYSLRLEPQPNFLNWVRDPLQNHLVRIDFPEPIEAMTITSELIADLDPRNPLDFLLDPEAAQYPFEYAAQLRKELAPYLRLPRRAARFRDWSAGLDRQPAYVVDFLSAHLRQMRQGITVDLAADIAPVDLDAVLSTRRASPWALAWLLTLGLRDLGFAARFVSGYVVGEGLAGVPVELRAWTDVFLPGAGWVGMDPIVGIFANENYLPLASAPEPERTLPLLAEREVPGVRRVEALHGRILRPAVRSFPHTGAQRREIEEMARQVEADLDRAGLRFSLQREIAVVAEAAADRPEWTYAALGTDKLAMAHQLLDRLRARLAPAGAPLATQAQWRAGEGLPRWKLMCVFRADGAPLWNQLEAAAARDGVSSLSIDDVKACAEAVTRRLGLSTSSLRAAYEDSLFAAWRQGDIWRRASPDEELDDPAQRLALAQRLSRSPGPPAGYVLPLHRDSGGWKSGPWELRRDEIYLSPGDSPMGLRLPLDSLPPAPPDTTAADTVDHVPRTALCFELRAGDLHVFLPPLQSFERYVAMLAAIDATLGAMGIAAFLEGYEPPDDPRLPHLAIEPDIGALRVSIPESRGWQQHAELLHIVYEECAALDLRAYRSLQSGARTPVRSSAPLAIRGAEARDNPFLRRPRLLRDLIRRWQSHPSLSYLFAPKPVALEGISLRADDPRPVNAYDVNIGLAQLMASDDDDGARPARALQHLLTDSKLDPRGAALRVDELTAADDVRAARGRLIWRCCETPPDPTTAVAQAVLLGALLARVGDPASPSHQPSDSEAWRDRFLLPKALWDDLCSLLTDIATTGYQLRPEWFRPWLDFHFPILGEVQIGDIAFELREAHEPQPILAEEVTTDGPVRFVDVANERVQLRVSGFTPARYAVSCNGHIVPLQGTGTAGELVSGIRYKARAPAATLHPTIQPVGELVFDLVDLWNDKPLGGCTYRPAAGGLSATGPSVFFAHAPAPPSVPGTPPADLLPRDPVLVSQPEAAGRFIPRGSAPGAPLRLVAGAHRPYLLDLTTRD